MLRDRGTFNDGVAGPSLAAPAVTDDTVAVLRLLENVMVIRSGEDPMTLSETMVYLRGFMMR